MSLLERLALRRSAAAPAANKTATGQAAVGKIATGIAQAGGSAIGRTATGRGRAPGALLLIGLCFSGSALARAADPDGTVLRAAITPDAIWAAGGALAPPGCLPGTEAGPLLAALREREAQLDARETEMASRARVLEAAEVTYREQAVLLGALQARLSATLAIADEAAEQDLARLVGVYESMNPKQAALIFETMDVTFAAGFLGRMQREAAARILAGLTPGRAYAVSVVIAGRNAAAPTE